MQHKQIPIRLQEAPFTRNWRQTGKSAEHAKSEGHPLFPYNCFAYYVPTTLARRLWLLHLPFSGTLPGVMAVAIPPPPPPQEQLIPSVLAPRDDSKLSPNPKIPFGLGPRPASYSCLAPTRTQACTSASVRQTGSPLADRPSQVPAALDRSAHWPSCHTRRRNPPRPLLSSCRTSSSPLRSTRRYSQPTLSAARRPTSSSAPSVPFLPSTPPPTSGRRLAV